MRQRAVAVACCFYALVQTRAQAVELGKVPSALAAQPQAKALAYSAAQRESIELEVHAVVVASLAVGPNSMGRLPLRLMAGRGARVRRPTRSFSKS